MDNKKIKSRDFLTLTFKAQIATFEFIMATTAILFIYLFLISFLNNMAEISEIEKNRAVLRADIEKISTYLLSNGIPENWTIYHGIPGLLCLNYNNSVCDEKLNSFITLCTINYSRIKKEWNLNSDFSLKLLNTTYEECLCNCGIINRKYSESDYISIPYNGSIYKILIITHSLK